MSDLDKILGRLAADPAPPELASIETEVLRRVDGHSFGSADTGPLRIGIVAAALVMGVIGGILPEGHARAERALAPLAGELEHAPSTLLAASR